MQDVAIYIVEDELIVAEELKGCLFALGYGIAGATDNFETAVKEILRLRPDVLLLDINLKGTPQSGIMIAEEIKQHFNPIIIFLTAYSDRETLDRAKKTDPDAYLIKPFDEQSLAVSIDIAVSKKIGISALQTDFSDILLEDRIFIKQKGKYTKVMYDEILYIEASGSYCIIHTEKQPITLSINMKTLCERLKYKLFVRIHRKYVVNTTKIGSFDPNYVYINGKSLDIGETFRDDLLAGFRYL